MPRPNVTTRRRLVPESALLPVRICLCGKGGHKSVRATVLVYAQDAITLPSDIPLIREHRALMAGAAACTWRYKIKFCDVQTDAMPVFFEYGLWDKNRNPDDATPYASQHSMQSFVKFTVYHRLLLRVKLASTAKTGVTTAKHRHYHRRFLRLKVASTAKTDVTTSKHRHYR